MLPRRPPRATALPAAPGALTAGRCSLPPAERRPPRSPMASSRRASAARWGSPARLRIRRCVGPVSMLVAGFQPRCRGRSHFLGCPATRTPRGGTEQSVARRRRRRQLRRRRHRRRCSLLCRLTGFHPSRFPSDSRHFRHRRHRRRRLPAAAWTARRRPRPHPRHPGRQRRPRCRRQNKTGRSGQTTRLQPQPWSELPTRRGGWTPQASAGCFPGPWRPRWQQDARRRWCSQLHRCWPRPRSAAQCTALARTRWGCAA